MRRKYKKNTNVPFMVDDDFKYEILENLSVLGVQDSGWSKELNIVQWNDRPPRLDIREWNVDHSRMSKGIGLTWQEGMKLREALNALDKDMIKKVKTEE